MKPRWRAARTLASLFLFLALGCRQSGDPVRDCLDTLVRAAHDRDASPIFERVAADFQSGDGSSRADAQALVRRYFSAYESLDVTLHDVSIERSESAARARFRAELAGRPRRIGGLEGLVPRLSSYDFDVRLAPEEGKWKIAWAQWKESEK